MKTGIDNHPKLGEYVKDDLGRTGRVTAIYHSCNQTKEWLAAQTFRTAEEKKGKGLWIDILVHGGGSIHVPATAAEVIAPFAFSNDWASFYFADGPSRPAE